MPIYEYQCKECDHVFEDWQKGFEDKSVPCPECEGESDRLISSTSFILKGSGWYVTDYTNRKPDAMNGKKKPVTTETTKASDAASSDSAPASTPPKKAESKAAAPAAK